MPQNDELDFELIDDEQEDSNEEITDTSDDESENSNEEDTTSTKSKKSNWKKVTKANKTLKSENAKLKAKIKALESESEEDEDFDDEDNDTSNTSETDLRFFFLENEEANSYKAEIKEAMEKYPQLSLPDLFTLVKAKKPAESESSQDFSTKSTNVKVKKKLADLTEEEALKLDAKTFLKYQRTKGKVQ